MTADDPTIRPARAADGPSLAALDRAAWSRLSEVSPRPAPDSGFFTDRRSPEQVLVAEERGRVVGYIRLVPPTELETNRHVRQIQGLAVTPACRGRGLGRALVEAACDAARSAGARRMTLRVLGHNGPARRLYERCGFTVEGVCPEEFLLDGVYVDDVLMGRRIG